MKKLRVKNMKRVKDKLDWEKRELIKAGITMIVVAAILLLDRTYFFYPPNLAPIWNNAWADSIGLISGILLLVAGLCNIKNDWLVVTTLCIASGFIGFLIAIELVHSWGANFIQFHPMIAFEAYFIVNILEISYRHHAKK